MVEGTAAQLRRLTVLIARAAGAFWPGIDARYAGDRVCEGLTTMPDLAQPIAELEHLLGDEKQCRTPRTR